MNPTSDNPALTSPPGTLLYLRIPMAWIAEVPDLAAFEGLPADGVRAFEAQYEPDERRAILGALDLALSEPAFDFATTMLPLPNGTVPPNAAIRDFLTKVRRSLRDR